MKKIYLILLALTCTMTTFAQNNLQLLKVMRSETEYVFSYDQRGHLSQFKIQVPYDNTTEYSGTYTYTDNEIRGNFESALRGTSIATLEHGKVVHEEQTCYSVRPDGTESPYLVNYYFTYEDNTLKSLTVKNINGRFTEFHYQLTWEGNNITRVDCKAVATDQTVEGAIALEYDTSVDNPYLCSWASILGGLISGVEGVFPYGALVSGYYGQRVKNLMIRYDVVEGDKQLMEKTFNFGMDYHVEAGKDQQGKVVTIKDLLEPDDEPVRIQWATTTGVERPLSEHHSVDRIFRLDGVPVSKPQHGIYIINGKKVIR